MSDDIVKWLRFHIWTDDPFALDRAADCIERLRAELAAERERHADLALAHGRVVWDRDAALAHVAKLREALERFIANADRADSDDLADTDATYVVVAHLRHARAVLEETKGDGG